jgi:hypothetical protein
VTMTAKNRSVRSANPKASRLRFVIAASMRS